MTPPNPASDISRQHSPRWPVIAAVFAISFASAALLHLAMQRLFAQNTAPVLDGSAPSMAALHPGWAPAAPEVITPPGVYQTAALAAGPLSSSTQPASWRATLWAGGQAHALHGASIALASRTTFKVELSGLPAGEVRVYAINARGESSGAPVWAARVPNGGKALSPALRLEGLRGLETLHVQHRDVHGRLRTKQVQIWHL